MTSMTICSAPPGAPVWWVGAARSGARVRVWAKTWFEARALVCRETQSAPEDVEVVLAPEPPPATPAAAAVSARP